ncbi:LysR family transcriptional regulator [Paraburkholderia sp. SARCC-3016]|jgi:DNA-binding transcriptional LysR family regulator|uniref:LysR family transcriptional regulator n=1 Tax=Paraburkholderia sp. SARCC-3016 TaxID=3058611 RepID=UPI0028094D80|nr:LysR family transcriptional regulator [Paraburkholderia sp. SARCC-3016]MDQ7982328.1 LysR family transcriptional regulator [Paraburkholderia sp. SARCC-3016]
MNAQPTLAELRALAAIAANRSFSKAADELELAASTLSHMMRGLEERLGMRLLNRTTRSVSPTQAGERLVAQIRPILQDLDNVFADIDAARDRPRGLLRLTASETVSMLLINAVIPAFLERYPEMAVDLVAEPAFVDIVAEGYDAGFRLGDAVPRDMVAVRFGKTSRMLPVASPAYLEGRARPRTPDDLSAHVCIRSRTPNGKPYKWEFARRGHAVEIDVQGPLMLNRTELMLAAALRGLGIAFVPERLAQPHLDEGTLCSLLEAWCPTYPGLFLYFPGHRQVPAGLRAFIEVLKELGNET